MNWHNILDFCQHFFNQITTILSFLILWMCIFLYFCFWVFICWVLCWFFLGGGWILFIILFIIMCFMFYYEIKRLFSDM
jgi:hypothetical protein